MIDIQNVTVQFQEKKVLDDVSATFHEGEMVGLVAPNGTGKSTLMNVLMNYVQPSKGRVLFDEKFSYTSKKNEVKIHQFISLMPDQSDLYNYLTGRQHLKIFATMWHSDEALIDETIDALKMAHYVDKKTGTYSLGMRQRLCLAMQLVADTKMMMMDEVMNGLDPYNVELISKLLVEKKQQGKIIIIASHLLDNLEKYADRIYLFHEGKLVNANEIIEGFSDASIKTIRVKQASETFKQQMKERFPEVRQQSLISDITLFHLPQADADYLSTLTSFFVERQMTNFSFGKMTLNDLYTHYYHEII